MRNAMMPLEYPAQLAVKTLSPVTRKTIWVRRNIFPEGHPTGPGNNLVKPQVRDAVRQDPVGTECPFPAPMPIYW